MNKAILFTIILAISIIFSPAVFATDKDIQIISSDTKTTTDNKIITYLTMRNEGVETVPKILFEMQVINNKCSNLQPLTFFQTGQTTCDARYPTNVHRIIYDWYGQKSGNALGNVFVKLTSPQLRGGTYCVVLLSTNGCCNQMSCSSMLPFGWGKQVAEVTLPVIPSAVSPVCGNGICENLENYGNCASDCVTYCGDGYCTGAETKASCANDCGSTPPTTPPLEEGGSGGVTAIPITTTTQGSTNWTVLGVLIGIGLIILFRLWRVFT